LRKVSVTVLETRGYRTSLPRSSCGRPAREARLDTEELFKSGVTGDGRSASGVRVR